LSTAVRAAAPDAAFPTLLLQRLIQFDTTNPPGREAPAIGYVDELLRGAGFQTTILARDPNRPNLVTRLKGRGAAPPLLLYGHLDVVPTTGQAWRHPPFAGAIDDGCVWGRGAVDMKGGLAMMLAALLRARAEDGEGALPGDVLLAVLSDEEGGSELGARYLVEEHAALFSGVRYAIGEVGGFTQHVGGRRFYPIAVAEKQRCSLRAVVRGPGGHGALPSRGGTLARLATLLRQLDRRRLPVHVTPLVRHMLTEMTAALPRPAATLLRQLLRPRLADRVLDLLGERGASFDPLLHNTVNATIVRAGDARNVVPSQAAVELDGRLLPGYGPADLVGELGQVVGPEVEWEVLRFEPGPGQPNLGLFDTLASILGEADPGGVPLPLLLAGVTDGRFFARLGIQTYGFTPMRLPPDLPFARLFHAADERIPIEALGFGAQAIYRLLQRSTTSAAT
jgi:acetylornithine deacetylase/succinyl-diaminopimelate desuccinylase-like protein